MPKPKTFVFNDESENSYGFSIPTKGISLKRFKKNPMMLDSHINMSGSVLGKWENVESKDGKLTGSPLFDKDDNNTVAVAGKVERGFISSCSMGVTFNPVDLKYINGKLVLEKCELYEVSIVPVPSNQNSVVLYSEEGEKLKESEVQKMCLSALPVEGAEEVPGQARNDNKDSKNSNSNNKPMKIKLAATLLAALGFAKSVTEVGADELEEKINGLIAEKDAAELKLSAKLEEEEAAKLAAITEKVETGIKNKLLSAEKKDQYVQLGVANEDLLDDVLANAPKKTSLAAQVQGKGGKDVEVKTADDFQKLDTEAQLAFKQTRPDEYQKLFSKK